MRVCNLYLYYVLLLGKCIKCQWRSILHHSTAILAILVTVNFFSLKRAFCVNFLKWAFCFSFSLSNETPFFQQINQWHPCRGLFIVVITRFQLFNLWTSISLFFFWKADMCEARFQVKRFSAAVKRFRDRCWYNLFIMGSKLGSKSLNFHS